MAGKNKTKPKKKAASSARAAASIQDLPKAIDEAQSWEGAVNVICAYFGLPDLTTRSGLKKVHAGFENIYKQLDSAYTKYPSDERIVGAIVGVYAKMCVDSLLRNKLFEKGLVTKLVPLFDMKTCRHIALQSLTTITHHGGTSARAEIARLTPTLVKIMQEHPDDEEIAELITVTLSHSIIAVTDVEELPDPKLIKLFNIPVTLATICDALRKPWASVYMITHTESLISNMAYHCSKEVRAYPPAVTFLTALLRSEDIALRCSSLLAFWRLLAKETEQDRGAPMNLFAAYGNKTPADVNKMLVEYGLERGDAAMTLRAMRDFQVAMNRVAQDKDLYKLGITLAELILRTEFAISDGGWNVIDELTGQREKSPDIGLPFTMYMDALPHCAKAIRAKGVASEKDLADILECKFFVARQRLPEAFALARRALERNPDAGYFYYIISLTPDSAKGLRSAKRGMKCKMYTTPFVKQALKHRAVDYAVDLSVGAFISKIAKFWESDLG